jgi:hypothetical protein
MKKRYNKNAREKQLLEEAYGAVYERRNPDAGTYDAEGELPGPIAELDPDEEEEKQYDATNVQLMKLIQNDIMNGMTAKESMEGMNIEPAYQKDLFRRYQKWADRWSEGPIEPESWFENEEEHDEYHPGYGKVKEHGHDKTGGMSDKALLASVEKKGTAGDALLRAAHERIRQGESLTPHERDALARDQYGYHGEDEEANVNWDEDKEVDEVGGGMNAKEFNTINKTTPL